ncbi:VOC family protein [Natronococcus sp. JC468]|uniref:VOC family protein n=1 Tax=Natronococcus sp. JC468 TaxID=1961921 RepID=UPI001438A494|nr:VOC family protein [Natronococcus sp. JC468]NKE36147.1 VOC family protein [Natronococcus sp. JC468]
MRAVDHVNVDVDDLEAAYPFYRDVLGLSVRRPPEEFHGEHAMFAVGATVLTLVETGRADGWAAADLEHPLDKAHLAFETDRASYDEYVAELDGQFPNQGPYDWDEFEGFYFLDPDGNLLEVITDEPPNGERDRPLLTHDDVA